MRCLRSAKIESHCGGTIWTFTTSRRLHFVRLPRWLFRRCGARFSRSAAGKFVTKSSGAGPDRIGPRFRRTRERNQPRHHLDHPKNKFGDRVVHAVVWTQCTDARRAGATTQVPGESSYWTRSIGAMTAGSSGSSPSSCRLDDSPPCSRIDQRTAARSRSSRVVAA